MDHVEAVAVNKADTAEATSDADAELGSHLLHSLADLQKEASDPCPCQFAARRIPRSGQSLP